MPLKAKRGEIKTNDFVSTPVIDWKSLGMTEKGKALKTFTKVNFVPIGEWNADLNEFSIEGMKFTDSGVSIFKYSWSTPDENATPQKGKPLPVQWHYVTWADSGLRIEDGDVYDDPGIMLGLHLKQDERKKAPGLRGAPEGAYVMIEPFTTDIYFPIIWKVALDDDAEIVSDSGEYALMKVSPYQMNTFIQTIALFDKQNTVAMKKAAKKSGAEFEPNEQRLFVVEFVKDPSKSMAEVNSVNVQFTIDPDEWTQKFYDIASKEFPKFVEREEKRLKFWKPIVDSLENGDIEEEDAINQVVASIVEKLMIGWGEIDENSGMSPVEINELFVELVPKYSAALTVTNSDVAVKGKQTVNLSDDNVVDEDAPF